MIIRKSIYNKLVLSSVDRKIKAHSNNHSVMIRYSFLIDCYHIDITFPFRYNRWRWQRQLLT